MKYIINNSVVFDVISRTLSIQDDAERSIDLPAPSARLLNEFIRVKGQFVTRDHLLKHVWEDYGFVVSSANLNNHISVLRRSFISLDQTGALITTIPKLGFQFDADVQAVLPNKSLDTPTMENDADASVQTTVEKSAALATEHSNNAGAPPTAPDADLVNEHGEHNSHQFAPNVLPGIEHQSVTSGKDKSKSLLNKSIPKVIALGLLFSLAISLSVLGIIKTNMNNITSGRFSPELLYTEGKCNIYSLDPHINSSNESFINEAKILLKSQVINCPTEEFDIFFQNDKGSDVRGQVYLVSKCKKEDDLSYSHCANFRFLEGV